MKAPDWKTIQNALRRTQALPAPRPAAVFWEQFRLRVATRPRPVTRTATGRDHDWGYAGWAWATAAAAIIIGAVVLTLIRQKPTPDLALSNNPQAPTEMTSMRAPPPLPLTPQQAKPEIKIATAPEKSGTNGDATSLAPRNPTVAGVAATAPLSSVESVDVQVDYCSVMIVQDEAHGATLVWLAGMDANP